MLEKLEPRDRDKLVRKKRGRVERLPTQFLVVDLLPKTLEAALQEFPGELPLPLPWVLSVLLGVRCGMQA